MAITTVPPPPADLSDLDIEGAEARLEAIDAERDKLLRGRNLPATNP